MNNPKDSINDEIINNLDLIDNNLNEVINNNEVNEVIEINNVAEQDERFIKLISNIREARFPKKDSNESLN